ncbi:FAD/NAD(P)-binding domain-containing protein [Polychaeton citri CBS 116435]|uniref:FAD/NAD(P)-binding domain-containing protein n=1 Tax=Polychaeton citri CBS 116435 TaxID=1314669 RepID=A0A9P4Q0Z5_9PEZI|nr:FAD/NAD(P)-binding domain-containing protein [Polychaeton citri CBS 116435]
MALSKLKVIVIGGGPVGLTAAHALSKAGIDFLVLERRPHIVMNAGSNLVLMPVDLRAMSQLDLLEPLSGVSSPLGRIDRLDHKGHDLGDLQFFNQMRENHGVAPRVISRHDLMSVLYETLPSEHQQNILSNKKLSDIASTADGVTVTCSDGSKYAGSIVIGADGAHSAVRDIMRRLSLAAGSEEVNLEEPFSTNFRALWVRFPKESDLAVGTTCETHGRDAATQLFVGEKSGVIGVYERLPEPTQKKVRYTEADQDALVDRWGHLPITGNSKFTLRDIYSKRLEAGLVSLEEGVVAHWSWNGRVVLAGDAAHKFTPSTGAGCNNGMIDIVALVNKLYPLALLSQASHGNESIRPGPGEFESAFKAYQASRHDAVLTECAGASRATVTATWQTAIHKFLDCRVMSSHKVQKFLINSGAKSIANSPSLFFAAGHTLANGRVPWAVPPLRATG